SADLNSHVRTVENLTKHLTRSGFEVTKESLTGLFFQLSLPNPESYPFVNVLRQLDFCMEAGDYKRRLLRPNHLKATKHLENHLLVLIRVLLDCSATSRSGVPSAEPEIMP
ncbi:uncharacterized protein VP01_10391g1, partial [Puccinia sorghi]